jgi:hypothetical protein
VDNDVAARPQQTARPQECLMLVVHMPEAGAEDQRVSRSPSGWQVDDVAAPCPDQSVSASVVPQHSITRVRCTADALAPVRHRLYATNVIATAQLS